MAGFPELLFIVMILIVVFGAHRLPALGEKIGHAIHGQEGPAPTVSDGPPDDSSPSET